jgi:DNA-binding NarL/FixJ family response regulator
LFRCALAELTAREPELLELIAEGLDNRELAERHELSDLAVSGAALIAPRPAPT